MLHVALGGADLLIRRKTGVPAVSLGVYASRAGRELRAEAGLGSLALRSVIRGAGQYDAEQLALAFERLGGSQRELKIFTMISDGSLNIQIADTGKGIDKDKIKNIFDPMVSSKMFSPGLGLTFASKIVQDHNGTISVESEPGRGTTFTIALPGQRNVNHGFFCFMQAEKGFIR